MSQPLMMTRNMLLLSGMFALLGIAYGSGLSGIKDVETRMKADEEHVRIIPSPQSWMLMLEQVDGTNGNRVVSGEGQCFIETDANHASCAILTDGTNRWEISVETSYKPVDGGYEATARIENRCARWRVVGFSGCETRLAGAQPEALSLYVPEGLGKRVNPIRPTTTLADRVKYEKELEDYRRKHYPEFYERGPLSEIKPVSYW